jgi:ABC-type uncharacterized transport system permease subunit
MSAALSSLTLVFAIALYGAATASYFAEIVRGNTRPSPSSGASIPPMAKRSHAPGLLGVGALAHAGYVTHASFVARVCPIHSVHFLLSVAALLAIAVYIALRNKLGIHALGLLVAPLGLAFVLGTYFLGKPIPTQHLPPVFIALHVMANLLGVALFLLAGGAAGLYLVQENRLKQKLRRASATALPALDTLDTAVHRFLIAGFPLLTIGIVTGTFWARQLEMGTPDEVIRIVLGYTTWLLFASVLLMRAALGWRGRRAAYGTIAGFACAAAVLVVYLVRPAAAGLGG